MEGRKGRKQKELYVNFREDELEQRWSDYKKEFDKTYKDSAEEELRKKNFEEKLKMFALHNQRYVKGEETWTMGINQFTDRGMNESGCCCGRRTSAASQST